MAEFPSLSRICSQIHSTDTRISKNRNEPYYGMDEMEAYHQAMLNEDGRATFFTYMEAQSVIGRLDRFIEGVVILALLWVLVCNMATFF